MTPDAIDKLVAERLGTLEEAPKNEIRAMAKRIVTDPAYIENLKKRAREGKLAPAVETYLLQIGGGGKPQDETVKKHQHEHAVRIEHTYMEESKAKKLPEPSIEAEVVSGEE